MSDMAERLALHVYGKRLLNYSMYVIMDRVAVYW